MLAALRFSIVYGVKRLLNQDASINYSQTGEDALIRSLLDETRPGFYVDVGCHDPIRSSNTLSLYMHGWRGVNVDANPDLIRRFQAVRLRDVAVCAAVSDQECGMLFHEFENPLVSTLASDALAEWETKWKKRGERLVQTRRLDSILEEHLPPDTEIDLLSIDVEGYDLNVLKSVNLDIYRPKLIIIEMHHFDPTRCGDNDIARYLGERAFRLVGYDSLNGYFVDAKGPRAGLRHSV